MQELWQLYDEQCRALSGRGANKDEVFGKGLLHGASHVWIWRNAKSGVEILLQKRATNKRTWPNHFDISAAGHIDLGETPLTAAIRETKEEIGIDVVESKLKLISVQRAFMVANNNAIENEYQWLYLLDLPEDTDFIMQEKEVTSVEWKPLETFKSETRNNNDLYVPHGCLYFDTVIAAIEFELAL